MLVLRNVLANNPSICLTLGSRAALQDAASAEPYREPTAQETIDSSSCQLYTVPVGNSNW